MQQAHAARDQRTLRGAEHQRVNVALDHFVNGRGASADQPNADERMEQRPREQRRTRFGGCEVRARPGSHHDQRSNSRFDEHGVIAGEGCNAYARDGERLSCAAHAVTAFCVAAWVADWETRALIMRLDCIASTTLVANTKAPPATCDTVLITMPVVDCGGSTIHCSRLRYEANPSPSCTINRARSNCAGLRNCATLPYRVRMRTTVQHSTAATTQAPTRCGRSFIPEWRKAAPRVNCTHTHDAASAVRVGVLGERSCSAIGSESCNHPWLVNSAIAITTQKMVCASVACAVEIDQGSRFSTVMPPRIPWPTTAASAIQPSTRIHLRCSTRWVHTAMTMISAPMNSAIMRCVCSYLIPPTIGGSLYREPKEVGQSATESPASLLVTSAPETIRKNVAQARKTAKRWCTWL